MPTNTIPRVYINLASYQSQPTPPKNSRTNPVHSCHLPRTWPRPMNNFNSIIARWSESIPRVTFPSAVGNRVDNNFISWRCGFIWLGERYRREIRDYLFMVRLMEVVLARNGYEPRVGPILADNVARTYRTVSAPRRLRRIKLMFWLDGRRTSATGMRDRSAMNRGSTPFPAAFISSFELFPASLRKQFSLCFSSFLVLLPRHVGCVGSLATLTRCVLVTRNRGFMWRHLAV